MKLLSPAAFHSFRCNVMRALLYALWCLRWTESSLCVIGYATSTLAVRRGRQKCMLIADKPTSMKRSPENVKLNWQRQGGVSELIHRIPQQLLATYSSKV